MNFDDYLRNMDKVREAINKQRERYREIFESYSPRPMRETVTEKWTAWVTDVYFIPEENQYRQLTQSEVDGFMAFGRKVHDDFFNPNCT